VLITPVFTDVGKKGGKEGNVIVHRGETGRFPRVGKIIDTKTSRKLIGPQAKRSRAVSEKDNFVRKREKRGKSKERPWNKKTVSFRRSRLIAETRTNTIGNCLMPETEGEAPYESVEQEPSLKKSDCRGRKKKKAVKSLRTTRGER